MAKITIPYNFDPEKRPFQLEILKNSKRFKSLVIHRRAGKTALALNHLIQQAMLTPNKVFWYVAPTYRQAKDIVWRDPDMLFRYCPKEIIAKKNETELTIKFINGSLLAIKGADDPDSLRGANPYGVVLDEFANIKPDVWEKIISPIVYANPEAWVWFIGTPSPVGGHFHKLHNDAEKNPDWFALTLKATTSGIIPEKWLAEARATMTEAGFRQEYECEWFDGGGVVFRGIDQVIYGSYKEPTKPENRQWGLDLAKHEDWTVLTGINRKSHYLDVFDRYNQIDWNMQKARIEATVRRLGNAGDRINADATGVGEPIVEDLHRQGLNVEGIKFTAGQKLNMITNLMIGIEQRKLYIPDIPELVGELRIFGYEITKAGNVRYSAPEGFHDDCVWSFALAYWEIGSMLKSASRIDQVLARQGLPSHMLTGNPKEPNTGVGGDFE